MKDSPLDTTVHELSMCYAHTITPHRTSLQTLSITLQETWWIQDTSTNGTFVQHEDNERWCRLDKGRSYPLQVGDLVRLSRRMHGKDTLVYRLVEIDESKEHKLSGNDANATSGIKEDPAKHKRGDGDVVDTTAEDVRRMERPDCEMVVFEDEQPRKQGVEGSGALGKRSREEKKKGAKSTTGGNQEIDRGNDGVTRECNRRDHKRVSMTGATEEALKLSESNKELRHRIETLEAEKLEMHSKVEDAERGRVEQTALVENLQSAVEQLRQREKELLTNLETMKSEWKDATEEVHKARQTHEDMEAREKELSMAVQTYKETNATLAEEVAALGQKIEEMHKEIEASEVQKREEEGKRKDMEAELIRLRDSEEQARLHLERIVDVAEELRANAESSKSEVESLRAQLKGTKSELKEARRSSLLLKHHEDANKEHGLLVRAMLKDVRAISQAMLARESAQLKRLQEDEVVAAEMVSKVESLVQRMCEEEDRMASPPRFEEPEAEAPKPIAENETEGMDVDPVSRQHDMGSTLPLWGSPFPQSLKLPESVGHPWEGQKPDDGSGSEVDGTTASDEGRRDITREHGVSSDVFDRIRATSSYSAREGKQNEYPLFELQDDQGLSKKGENVDVASEDEEMQRAAAAEIAKKAIESVLKDDGTQKTSSRILEDSENFMELESNIDLHRPSGRFLGSYKGSARIEETPAGFVGDPESKIYSEDVQGFQSWTVVQGDRPSPGTRSNDENSDGAGVTPKDSVVKETQGLDPGIENQNITHCSPKDQCRQSQEGSGLRADITRSPLVPEDVVHLDDW